MVSPGTPLLRIDDPEDIWLRVYVPEVHLAKVKVGDPAKIEVDGIEGWLSADVESIAVEGEYTPANLQTPSERGRQVFAVRLRLRAPDRRIKAGMYASVRRLGQWSE
ncbi:MAG: efflux RND transporter periplasmic adaptor subunit [Fimbriimonadaceae bacterium]|nr:efflux RND transporter periplasmic adaptor subunit [Fimbriimonadaceae bacterium]